MVRDLDKAIGAGNTQCKTETTFQPSDKVWIRDLSIDPVTRLTPTYIVDSSVIHCPAALSADNAKSILICVLGRVMIINLWVFKNSPQSGEGVYKLGGSCLLSPTNYISTSTSWKVQNSPPMISNLWYLKTFLWKKSFFFYTAILECLDHILFPCCSTCC